VQLYASCNSWTINLANLGRHAQLTRCFSAVAELLARSSATAEKQRASMKFAVELPLKTMQKLAECELAGIDVE